MSKVALRNAEGPKLRVAGRRRITDYDMRTIVQIVRNWPAAPITWELIVEKVERELAVADPEGKKSGLGGWTRQGLSRRPAIKKAYLERRTELAIEVERVKKNPARNRDPEIVVLRRERDALKIENAQLIEQIQQYRQRIAFMTHNAAVGKPPDQLEQPLKKKMHRRGLD